MKVRLCSDAFAVDCYKQSSHSKNHLQYFLNITFTLLCNGFHCLFCKIKLSKKWVRKHIFREEEGEVKPVFKNSFSNKKGENQSSVTIYEYRNK